MLSFLKTNRKVIKMSINLKELYLDIDFKIYRFEQFCAKIFKKIKKKFKKPYTFEDALSEYIRISAQSSKDSLMPEIDLDGIYEEASKEIVIPGKGITCMIPGKYSREYTDYFIGQLADHFGFKFFHDKITDLKLEKHQKFRPAKDYVEEFEYTNYRYIEDVARIMSRHCEDGVKSVERFEDMMFFDGLILNNKKNTSHFGFIVDKEDETKKYKFVCFYDEYNSFFDWFNGIDFTIDDEYEKIIYTVMSWTDGKNHREFATNYSIRYRRPRHVKKLKLLHPKFTDWKFKEDSNHQLSEVQYINSLDREASIFQVHIWFEARNLVSGYETQMFRQELLKNPQKMKKFLEEQNRKPKTEEEHQEAIIARKKYLYRMMRSDGNINKKQKN